MTTKRIVWTAADGTVIVLVPAPQSQRPDESETEWLARLAARIVPPGASGRVIEAADLPSRRFRNCWRAAGPFVAVDLPLARAQVVAEVRAECDRRMRIADAEKARLDDVGTPQEKQALAARRQALRDLPATVQVQIAGLDAAALESYQPTWP